MRSGTGADLGGAESKLPRFSHRFAPEAALLSNFAKWSLYAFNDLTVTTVRVGNANPLHEAREHGNISG